MGTEDLTHFDIGALIVCGALMIIYNAAFFLSLHYTKPPPQLLLNLENVDQWIQRHKEKEDPNDALVAIQTMRNIIVISVFVGGYSISFAYNTLNTYSSNLTVRMKIRAIVLGILWFGSFLSWACVIRHAAYLGYMIGTMRDNDSASRKSFDQNSVSMEEGKEGNKEYHVKSLKNETPSEAKKRREMHEHESYLAEKSKYIMRHLLIYFSLGFRFMFAAIPFAFYIIGPTALVIATGVMLLFFWQHDFLNNAEQENDRRNGAKHVN